MVSVCDEDPHADTSTVATTNVARTVGEKEATRRATVDTIVDTTPNSAGALPSEEGVPTGSKPCAEELGGCYASQSSTVELHAVNNPRKCWKAGSYCGLKEASRSRHEADAAPVHA